LIILIAAFLTATPLVLFFSFGYSYDFENHALLKTGAITVNTQPRGAVVTFDGKILDSTTPLHVKHLLPGQYTIKIQKDGYRDWEDVITVESRQVTEIPAKSEKLFMVLDSIKPETILEGVAEIVSTENESYARIATSTLTYQNLSTETKVSFPIASATDTYSRPTKNSDWTIITGAEQINVVNLVTGAYVNMNGLSPRPETIEVSGNNLAYFINSSGQLMELELATGKSRLMQNSVSSFKLNPYQQTILYIQGPNLIAIDYASTTKDTLFKAIPEFEQAQIIPTPKETIVLLDGRLYLIDGQALDIIMKDVTFVDYHQDFATLILGNSRNIWLFDIQHKVLTSLIADATDEIKDAVLSKTTNLLFYKEKEALKAVEIFSQNERKIYLLMSSAPVLGRFYLNDKEDGVILRSDSVVQNVKFR